MTHPLLHLINQANNADLADFYPLYINQQHVGLIKKTTLPLLADYLPSLLKEGDSLHLQGEYQTLSQQFADMAKSLYQQGILQEWRDERFPIKSAFNALVLAVIERAAIPIIGACGYGTHLNGLVRKKDGLYMWLSKRASTKAIEPNKWDQIAAGGLPHGIAAHKNMQKEAQEEAGIPFALSQDLHSVGMIAYRRDFPYGIRADRMLIYDLFLPESFTPKNQDGEAQAFVCLPLCEVLELLENEGAQIKFNSALVMIDCLIRYGIITPDYPIYEQLCQSI